MVQARRSMAQHLRDRPYDTKSFGVSDGPGNTKDHRDRKEQDTDLQPSKGLPRWVIDHASSARPSHDPGF